MPVLKLKIQALERRVAEYEEREARYEAEKSASEAKRAELQACIAEMSIERMQWQGKASLEAQARLVPRPETPPTSMSLGLDTMLPTMSSSPRALMVDDSVSTS